MLRLRPYQIPLWNYLDKGGKRAVIVWHRRAGKDLLCWNYTVTEACTGRAGTYTYYFPTASLAKKVIWDGADKSGRRFLDFIPRQLIKRLNSTEMKIELYNGNIIRLAGTDKVVNVGTNPVGTIFSEFSLQNPRSWNYIRPILAENDGWALFNGTPRGRNHFYELYEMAKGNPDWFCQSLTVDDTRAVSDEAIEIERRAGMSEDLILQEFYVSWDCGVQGAIFGRQMMTARNDNRIGHVPYDENLLVYTAWDIGIGDCTAMIFFQIQGESIRIIDHYENSGFALAHYLNILKTKPYAANYGGHFVPHDAQHKNQVTGHTYVSGAAELGVDMTTIPLDYSIEEKIECARGLFSRIFIDEHKCDYLIKCLLQYHYEFDDNAKRLRDRPDHDWSSHSSDSLMYLCLAVKNGMVGSRGKTKWDAIKAQHGYYGNNSPVNIHTQRFIP